MHVQPAIALDDRGQRPGEVGVQLRGAAEHPPRQLIGRPDPLPEQRQAAQVQIVRLEVCGRRPRQGLALGAQQLDLQRAHDAAGDLVLDREQVGQRPVVALGPDLTAGGSVDQPRRDAHPVASPAHAAVEDVAHLEPGAGRHRVLRRLAHGEARRARGHEQAGDLGQLGDQILGHAGAEIVLARILREILERQHGDRWARRGNRRRRRHAGRRGRELEGEAVQRPIADLEHPLAEIDEASARPCRRPARVPRPTRRCRRGSPAPAAAPRSQRPRRPSRASTTMSPRWTPMRYAMCRSFGTSDVALLHAALDGHGTTQRVDHARELDQGRTAPDPDHAPAMPRQQRLDELLPSARATLPACRACRPASAA